MAFPQSCSLSRAAQANVSRAIAGYYCCAPALPRSCSPCSPSAPLYSLTSASKAALVTFQTKSGNLSVITLCVQEKEQSLLKGEQRRVRESSRRALGEIKQSLRLFRPLLDNVNMLKPFLYGLIDGFQVFFVYKIIAIKVLQLPAVR